MEIAYNNRFWENILTSSWPNQKAELHVIVPTMLITKLSEYNPKDYPDRSTLEHVSSMQHTLCCECGESAVDQTCLVGFRFLISKVELPYVFYKTAFSSCVFCEACAVKTEVKLKCDYLMINAVLDELEAIAEEFNDLLFMVDMPVQMFLTCLLNRLRVTHGSLMQMFGLFFHHCMFCKKNKKKAKYKCPGCKMNTYCNKKCWKQDWALHQVECLWLQKMSIFTAPEHHLILK